MLFALIIYSIGTTIWSERFYSTKSIDNVVLDYFSYYNFFELFISLYRKVGWEEEEQVFLAEFPKVAERTNASDFQRFVEL